MVNKDLLLSRMEQINKHLEKMAPFETLNYQEFIKDNVAQDVVEYNLFQMINHLIDMIQHIVVDEQYGYPRTAYDAAQLMHDKRLFSKKDLETFKKMIGFRNVVGHDYLSIDKEIVYGILTKGKRDVQRIVSKIAKNFL
jgi:uncharacterized protein YutE (UPF0331/DUF86 family)